ncbi:MAG TPA: glycosyltransferase family 39 protein [Gallionellaceae bacterium]|nr:glycosyltransferase family 39 protein [Gallionellaceae bacterium]
MFPYATANEHPITLPKAGLLALLIAVWLLTGIVGHDPWKPGEAYSFGLVYHILHSGDWLVPTLAGEPRMGQPPLFYMTAALFAKVLSPILPLHDGARLASAFYMALTLLFTGLAGRDLFGKYRGWSAAIILIGCLGLLIHAHLLAADLALLAGCAMMIYGYGLALRFRRRAGVFIGIGVGIGFMSKGFIAIVLFVAISALLLLFRNWRNRPYYIALGIALLCALPWLTIWPWLLYERSPRLFTDWLWTHNIGHWLNYARHHFGHRAWYYAQELPWLAWPAWPLAAWSVWNVRRNLRYEPQHQLLLVAFAVMLVALSLTPDLAEVLSLPLLLPLALLATAALPSLRRGAANALDWFGIMTFGLLAILLWWGWAGLLLDNNAKITHWLKDYQPGFHPVFQPAPFWIAVGATVLWIVLVWRVGRSVRRSVINWASGMTLVWVLAMTLWLPWLESGKSYRGVVASLKQALPAHYNCIAGERLGDSQRAMLDYFGGITTERLARSRCSLLLVQANAAKPVASEPDWRLIWEGARTGDKKERFKLYKKVAER